MCNCKETLFHLKSQLILCKQSLETDIEQKKYVDEV